MAKELNISLEIGEILDKYGYEIKAEVDALAKEVTQEAVKELKASSPRNRPKYYKGWTVKEETVGVNKAYIIHNKDYPGLTHLLEKGHATRNGGRTQAQPHIGPAEKAAIKKFNKGVEEVVRNK